MQFSSRGLWIKKPERKKRKVRFVGGKRRKGQHKSKASIAAGKRNAAKQKKAPGGFRFSGKSIVCDSENKITQTCSAKSVPPKEKKNPQSGKGIFKPVTLSAALSKVTGINGKTTRGQVFKALWAYIKKKAPRGFRFSRKSIVCGSVGIVTASNCCMHPKQSGKTSGHQQGPHRRQDRRPLERRLDVQDDGRGEHARPDLPGFRGRC